MHDTDVMNRHQRRERRRTTRTAVMHRSNSSHLFSCSILEAQPQYLPLPLVPLDACRVSPAPNRRKMGDCRTVVSPGMAKSRCWIFAHPCFVVMCRSDSRMVDESDTQRSKSAQDTGGSQGDAHAIVVYHRFCSPDAPTPSMRSLNLR